MTTVAYRCDRCGECCNFAQAGHRLYVTNLELAYFLTKVGELK